ncbi:hypothetical protein TgHK011_006306 [Trichoderma gracile]|nr:hypothetical protein TgHK011_006306 [Trichoderma gracile]
MPPTEGVFQFNRRHNTGFPRLVVPHEAIPETKQSGTSTKPSKSQRFTTSNGTSFSIQVDVTGEGPVSSRLNSISGESRQRRNYWLSISRPFSVLSVTLGLLAFRIMIRSSLGNKQREGTWDGLPREIRLLILKFVMEDDDCKPSRLVTVSREWQTEIERYQFTRLRLTPSRLVDFGSMTHRNRALVEHIWFCLELDDYDCTKCAPPSGSTVEESEDAYAVTDTAHCPITTAFQNLFSVLSTWEPSGDLTLDISIYSPSDSRHWFKYLTFMPDVPAEMVGSDTEQTIQSQISHDSQHGWMDGVRQSAPPRSAINKIFHSVLEEGPFDSEQLELQWWNQLPPAPAVTRLTLRQQNRRRWRPTSLAHMFARFPRLQEVHYEPWREWGSMQRQTDTEYEYLLESIQHFNDYLKRLVLFENFNQQYPAIMQRFMNGHDLYECHPLRNPSPAISRIVAATSFKLEYLAASFMVDARYFLNIETSWEWPNLASLALTSTLLSPGADADEMGAMFEKAAAAAMKMPQLETMEIWNGRKGLAALFQYQVFHDRRQARITWRGTWELTMEPSLIQAWEALVQQRYPGWDQEIDVVHERLDQDVIKSHGDAIRHLMLSSQVIRPVSLQQIQMEQKALEGARTV